MRFAIYFMHFRKERGFRLIHFLWKRIKSFHYAMPLFISVFVPSRLILINGKKIHIPMPAGYLVD